MRGIRIKDKRPKGREVIDLRDILRVLDAELSKVTQWKIRFVDYTAVDIAASDSTNSAHSKIGQFRVEHCNWSNQELKDFAEGIHQTFDAEIEGYKKTSKGKRVHIRIIAFDTSWWDVFSTDEKVLRTIEAGFKTTQWIESADE